MGLVIFRWWLKDHSCIQFNSLSLTQTSTKTQFDDCWTCVGENHSKNVTNWCIGWFQKISIPYHGRHLHLDPPCLRKFQNAQPPLALGIPNRSTPPPPCLRNSIIIQKPPRNCRFFLPTDLKSPLYIPNTFIKRKLILSLPPKEKTYIQHRKQSTLRNDKQRPTEWYFTL